MRITKANPRALGEATVTIGVVLAGIGGGDRGPAALAGQAVPEAREVPDAKVADHAPKLEDRAAIAGR